MAFLKETQRSLRTYFLLFGGLSAVIGFSTMSDYQQLEPLGIPASWKLALIMSTVSSTLIGLGYFIAGIKLKDALLSGAGWIKTMLYGSMGLIVITSVYTEYVLPRVAGSGAVLRGAIGVALTFYLLSNVKRLSHEAQNPPPPKVA